MVSAILAAILLASAPHPATSAEWPRPAETKPVETKPTDTKPVEKTKEKETTAPPATKASVTKHRIKVGGKTLEYTATAGELPLTNDAGESDADIFYISYTAEHPKPAQRRPLLFIFNGGPGAASVWLHLGAIGPRRVEMLPDGAMPAPPFHIVDNADTWLAEADLVFVDPVGTGYSRAVKPESTKSFTSARGDIESMGRFIRLYLTRNERWGSPLFLVGESYGTFRAAGLSEHLAEHGIALNGIVLISSILNLETVSFDNGNDLPYELFLPSYTATAWYHKKLSPELQRDLGETLRQAESFASTGFLTALDQGDRLPARERSEVVAQLSRFTGLDRAFIDNRNLRIDSRTFARELLRDQSKVVGYLDSRFTAANLDPSAPSGFDPTITNIRPPFTATFNTYVRKELGYHNDREYFTLGGGIGAWDWDAKNSYADTSDNLRNTFAKNPYMKLFVASGCFDLATPHFATDYTLAHLGLPPSLKQNVAVRRYQAGHMMYLEKQSLDQLHKDVAQFIEGAVPKIK